MSPKNQQYRTKIRSPTRNEEALFYATTVELLYYHMVGGGGAEGGVQLKSGFVGSFGGYLTFYLPLLKHIVPILKGDQKYKEYRRAFFSGNVTLNIPFFIFTILLYCISSSGLLFLLFKLSAIATQGRICKLLRSLGFDSKVRQPI